jgi:hypothetical protein
MPECKYGYSNNIKNCNASIDGKCNIDNEPCNAIIPEHDVALKTKYEKKLWCHLKSDEERVEFLQCGRAWETGIIANAIVKDIIDVYTFRIIESVKLKQSDKTG